MQSQSIVIWVGAGRILPSITPKYGASLQNFSAPSAGETVPNNRAKRISSGKPSVEPCAVRAIRKLPHFQAFRFENIPRSLPSNGNATATPSAWAARTRKPKAAPSHAAQNFDLVFFSSTKHDLHHRKKTARQQLAAINLLKKKNFSTTSPKQSSPRKKVHEEMSRICPATLLPYPYVQGCRPAALRLTLSSGPPFSSHQ